MRCDISFFSYPSSLGVSKSWSITSNLQASCIGRDHPAAAVMVSSTPFYELQLTVLAIFCVCAVIIERRYGKKEEPTGSNGHGRTSSVVASSAEAGSTGRHTSTAVALERQYLIVYGMVMCEHFIASRVDSMRLTAAQLPTGFKDHTFIHYTMNNTHSLNESSQHSLSLDSCLQEFQRLW